MALILVLVNVSNLAEVSDYKGQVLVGDGTVGRSRVIAYGDVKGHRRSDGWKVLVEKFLHSHDMAELEEKFRSAAPKQASDVSPPEP